MFVALKSMQKSKSNLKLKLGLIIFTGATIFFDFVNKDLFYLFTTNSFVKIKGLILILSTCIISSSSFVICIFVFVICDVFFSIICCSKISVLKIFT